MYAYIFQPVSGQFAKIFKFKIGLMDGKAGYQGDHWLVDLKFSGKLAWGHY